MQILIATHNPAKLQRYKSLLEPIGNLELVSLSDLTITDKVDEPFTNSKDNAIHKVQFYAKQSGITTLAIDEAALIARALWTEAYCVHKAKAIKKATL